MPLRTIDVDGVEWTVGPTGRRTQYAKDEFSVRFARADGREVRVARYSPQGSKAREASLHELSDGQLADLLRRSQPSWTTPELGYRR